MDKSRGMIIFCLTLIAATRAFPIDYDTSDVVEGNSINTKDNAMMPLRTQNVRDDYQDEYLLDGVNKRESELFENSQKRNIISALRAKIRRSKPYDVEDKLRFSPVLSVDALGNLNGFFGNLASNLQTMENRNLLPNQMRLLGEVENRPRDVYGHSAAFINSVRSYQSPKHIRKLMDYQPESHRNSNFYDPVLTRIGLGK